jgi:hypothetical protein
MNPIVPCTASQTNKKRKSANWHMGKDGAAPVEAKTKCGTFDMVLAAAHGEALSLASWRQKRAAVTSSALSLGAALLRHLHGVLCTATAVWHHQLCNCNCKCRVTCRSQHPAPPLLSISALLLPLASAVAIDRSLIPNYTIPIR